MSLKKAGRPKTRGGSRQKARKSSPRAAGPARTQPGKSKPQRAKTKKKVAQRATKKSLVTVAQRATKKNREKVARRATKKSLVKVAQRATKKSLVKVAQRATKKSLVKVARRATKKSLVKVAQRAVASSAPRVTPVAVALTPPPQVAVTARVLEQNGTRIYVRARTDVAPVSAHRDGPRIIPLRRELEARPEPEAPRSVELGSSPQAAPRPVTPVVRRAAPTPAASAPLMGVKRPTVPRAAETPGELAAAVQLRVGAAIAAATPCSPPRPFTSERWSELDRAAADIGVTRLDSEQRRTLRAMLEGRDVLAITSPRPHAAQFALAVASCLTEPTVYLHAQGRGADARAAELRERGLAVVSVSHDLRGALRSQTMARIARGGSLAVLVEADQIHTIDLARALAAAGVARVILEDAHAASRFADEVRPAYLAVGAWLGRLGRPPVTAITSTAPTAVRHDLEGALGLRTPVLVEAPPVRESLLLDVASCRGEVRQRALVGLVLRLRRPGVVIASSPRDVEAVYGALAALRVPVQRLHSELPAPQREREIAAFCEPHRRSVLCAESAAVVPGGLLGRAALDEAPTGFGLDATRRDVSFIVHYQAPASLEQYVRDLGATGIDGEPVSALLLHDVNDASDHEARAASVRPRADRLVALAASLEEAALDGRSISVEAAALAAGQSRVATDALARLLDDLGPLAQAGGWLRAVTSGPELLARARDLGVLLDGARHASARRAAAVSAYAETRGCLASALVRHFDVEPTGDCGRCSGCTGRSDIVGVDDASGSRRAPARELTVTRVGQGYSAGGAWPRPRHDASPLTAKLGDFRRG